MGAQLASAHSALNMKLLVVLALAAIAPLSLKPRQRLLLILTSTATEDTDWDTDTVLEDTTVDTVLATTASVRLRLPPTFYGSGYYGHGLGYYGLGYRGYYYGKREAEAAPKAEADPYLLYGGLRTYGYGLGYYGLAHHGTTARGRLRLPLRLRL